MHTTSGRWQLGLALALTTAVCWGLLPIALKITLAGMDAWTLTWYRFATAAAVLGAFLAWRRRLPLRKPLDRRAAWLYAWRCSGWSATTSSYLVAVELTTPTVAPGPHPARAPVPAVRRTDRVPRALRAAAVAGSWCWCGPWRVLPTIASRKCSRSRRSSGWAWRSCCSRPLPGRVYALAAKQCSRASRRSRSCS